MRRIILATLGVLNLIGAGRMLTYENYGVAFIAILAGVSLLFVSMEIRQC